MEIEEESTGYLLTGRIRAATLDRHSARVELFLVHSWNSTANNILFLRPSAAHGRAWVVSALDRPSRTSVRNITPENLFDSETSVGAF